MRSNLLPAVLIAIATFILYGCSDKNIPAPHPIIGSWKFDLPGTSCSEIYTFKKNKIRLFTSGLEVGKSRFEISQNASPAGFYKIVDTIIKTNKKPDCSGSMTPEGDVATLYIRFNQANDAWIICKDESSNICFGSYQKVKTD